MPSERPDSGSVEDPESQLEQAFIAEFLRAHGYDTHTIKELPEEQRTQFMKQASVYAAGKLAEVEARAQFVKELHGHDNDE
jgi:hypothetical protein